jgi:hypothetical protein
MRRFSYTFTIAAPGNLEPIRQEVRDLFPDADFVSFFETAKGEVSCRMVLTVPSFEAGFAVISDTLGEG